MDRNKKGSKQGLQYGPLAGSAAHLCVDMQNLFATGAPWETPWLDRVRPVALSMCHAHPDRTVLTRFIPPERPEEAPGTWRRFYERWQEVTRSRVDPTLLELLPEFAALIPPAQVIDKPAYSPFFRTDLDDRLRRRGIDTLIVTGTETDVCVLAAVLDAVDLGYRTIVVRDGICSSSDTTHDALMTLYHRRFRHQVEVADAEEVVTAWRR